MRKDALSFVVGIEYLASRRLLPILFIHMYISGMHNPGWNSDRCSLECAQYLEWESQPVHAHIPANPIRRVVGKCAQLFWQINK